MGVLLAVSLPLLYSLPVLLVAIILDLFLGIAAATKEKTFSIKMLPQFIQSQILTYYLPIVGLVALAQINWGYFGVSGAALGFTTAGVVATAWAAIGAYGLKVLFVNIQANLLVIFGITLTVTAQVKKSKAA